jgi:hypothetical protein
MRPPMCAPHCCRRILPGPHPGHSLLLPPHNTKVSTVQHPNYNNRVSLSDTFYNLLAISTQTTAITSPNNPGRQVSQPPRKWGEWPKTSPKATQTARAQPGCGSGWVSPPFCCSREGEGSWPHSSLGIQYRWDVSGEDFGSQQENKEPLPQARSSSCHVHSPLGQLA